MINQILPNGYQFKSKDGIIYKVLAYNIQNDYLYFVSTLTSNTSMYTTTQYMSLEYINNIKH